ncbi:hypothetical protein ABTM10_19575, partial [Acinetobacter baumannii]
MAKWRMVRKLLLKNRFNCPPEKPVNLITAVLFVLSINKTRFDNKFLALLLKLGIVSGGMGVGSTGNLFREESRLGGINVNDLRFT